MSGTEIHFLNEITISLEHSVIPHGRNIPCGSLEVSAVDRVRAAAYLAIHNGAPHITLA